jgi:hypothetical protein
VGEGVEAGAGEYGRLDKQEPEAAQAEFCVFERIDQYQTRLIQRLHRACHALQEAKIQYGVAGGNAVAAWVASVDESAVRTTQGVDILLRRTDLDAAKSALEKAGLYSHNVERSVFFVDGPQGKAREGVHVVFAGELTRPEYSIPAPDVDEVELLSKGYYVISLEAIVRMKLISFRRKDQVHLDDMISVGLIHESWVEKYPPELSDRLRHLLENPEE